MSSLTKPSTMGAPLVNTQSISPISTKKSNTSAVDTKSGPVAEQPQPANALKKDISTPTFCVLAISGSIGAGLLIASGGALARGGPGGVVLAFALVGAMVWCVMLALGELSASFPVQGSFYDYSVRFISENWGFAMGWNYVLNFNLIVAFELTVMMMIAQFWIPPEVSNVRSGLIALVPACVVVLVVIQAFGAKGYGRVEQVFGVMKVLVLLTVVVVGIVIATGGTKEAGGRGFENWQGGQAFLHGLPGFISTFVAAGMAYGGTEMLGLTVAECKHPRKVMPLGAMIVIARIILCYLLPLIVVGFILKPSAFHLPEFEALHAVSPFVVAIQLAGLPLLAHIINAILLLSVFSMANASCFATSRAMVSICRKGMGPRVLGEVTQRGIPRNALLVVFAVAQLAWVAAAKNGGVIFDWLLALASVSNYFTWVSISVCHIRMRMAVRRQGRSTSELVWKSPLDIYGSYFVIVMCLLCMLAQVASASLPPVTPVELSRLQLLFMGILGFIVVLVFYLGHLFLVARKQSDKTWREKLWIPLETIRLPELDARAFEEITAVAEEK